MTSFLSAGGASGAPPPTSVTISTRSSGPRRCSPWRAAGTTARLTSTATFLGSWPSWRSRSATLNGAGSWRGWPLPVRVNPGGLPVPRSCRRAGGIVAAHGLTSHCSAGVADEDEGSPPVERCSEGRSRPTRHVSCSSLALPSVHRERHRLHHVDVLPLRPHGQLQQRRPFHAQLHDAAHVVVLDRPPLFVRPLSGPSPLRRQLPQLPSQVLHPPGLETAGWSPADHPPVALGHPVQRDPVAPPHPLRRRQPLPRPLAALPGPLRIRGQRPSGRRHHERLHAAALVVIEADGARLARLRV